MSTQLGELRDQEVSLTVEECAGLGWPRRPEVVTQSRRGGLVVPVGIDFTEVVGAARHGDPTHVVHPRERMPATAAA